MQIKIDEEIKNLNLELNESAYNEMKAMYQEEGRIHPEIVIWKGQGIIVDGHHRYQIAQELGLECPYEEREFDSKNTAMIYALRVQGAGRRSDSDLEVAYHIGKQYLLMKLPEGRQPGQGQLGHGQLGQNVQVKPTAGRIATRLGIDEKTVRRHAEFAAAIDLIKTKVSNDLWKEILRGDLEIKRDDLLQLVKFLKKEDLFYLPPPTEEEIKELRQNIADIEQEHLQSGEPNTPLEMSNSLSMKYLEHDATEVVFCPFCGQGSECHLILTWSNCNHSIAEAVVKAKENLEHFSAEANARTNARLAAEKEKTQKKLISVDIITSNILQEAYEKREWWDKSTISNVINQIEKLKFKKREEYR